MGCPAGRWCAGEVWGVGGLGLRSRTVSKPGSSSSSASSSRGGSSSGGSGFISRLHSDDLGKLLLRVSVGGLMLFHGINKVQTGVGGMMGMIESRGLPGAMAYGAYVGEVLAPICMILGLFTRIGGLLVAFTMVMAVYIAHMGDIGKLQDMGGGLVLEVQMLYLMGSVAVFFLGGGRFSVSRATGLARAWS